MSSNDEETVTTMKNLLQRYEPLSNLNDTNLTQLARGASSFQLNKRQRLIAADEHRWLVYLVSGSVQGKDAQGEVFNIRPVKSGQTALFDAQPRPVEVTVVDDAQFLRVDRKQFSVLMNEQISSSTHVEEIEIDDSDEDMFGTLIQSYQSGAPKLPLRDSVVKTVTTLLADESSGTDNVLLDIMRTEPALTLVIAEIAGTSGQVQAGALIHLKQLIGLADRSQIAAELSQWNRETPFPEAGTPMYARLVTAYDFLRRVGTFSRAIASQLKGVDADMAEYAGMSSKVGVISGWLMKGASSEDLSEGDFKNSDLLATLVTEMLLSQMRVDSQIISCVEDVNGEATQQDSEISVSDVVRVALTYLPMDILGEPVSLVEDERLMDLFGKSGIGLRELDMIMEKCELDSGSGMRMTG